MEKKNRKNEGVKKVMMRFKMRSLRATIWTWKVMTTIVGF
jgi:hypothetical protein